MFAPSRFAGMNPSGSLKLGSRDILSTNRSHRSMHEGLDDRRKTAGSQTESVSLRVPQNACPTRRWSRGSLQHRAVDTNGRKRLWRDHVRELSLTAFDQLTVFDQLTEDCNHFRLVTCLVRSLSTAYCLFSTNPSASLSISTSHTRAGLSRSANSSTSLQRHARHHTINYHNVF